MSFKKILMKRALTLLTFLIKYILIGKYIFLTYIFTNVTISLTKGTAFYQYQHSNLTKTLILWLQTNKLITYPKSHGKLIQ